MLARQSFRFLSGLLGHHFEVCSRIRRSSFAAHEHTVTSMTTKRQCFTSRGAPPEVHVTAKDTWLGPTLNLGGIGAMYNLTMDPYEKYDMVFNGAVATRSTTTSPGRYAGIDNGWALALLQPVIIEFDKSIVDFPNIKRLPGGASNDQIPNLQNPANPVPNMDFTKPLRTKGGMDD
jgi:hypothetical protein